MENGHRQVTYVVVTIDEVIEALALAIRTSAQKAELIALTRALELSQGKNVKIYTDSTDTFMPWMGGSIGWTVVPYTTMLWGQFLVKAHT